ncbi:MAG TPA: 3-methyl-2-oxobutanoate hydroxymethyltransferase [Lentisphaeria bacterium]|nr:MAG: 3-methyl-2-oxobutanoate hydroxymethyltransferase [Lentisphaerae bacterium GWF2_38_69]HBM14743.1 3-methyl-2-oxobutanoate hydroxymethyltransferase [Lentisphaeria bacterium]
MISIHEFKQKKERKEKISIVTCYDYTTAKIVDKSSVDCVLVGDSGTMTMYGCESTIQATMEMMVLLTSAVAKGTTKFIIGDMPFLSCRKGLTETMNNVHSIMKAGANAVKLEGLKGNEEIIKYITDSGIPVMGHIGLTPQAINMIGGYKVQGKLHSEAERLKNEAIELEKLGCFSIVLECMPVELAREISNSLAIPAIGIGAGPFTDGQVIVIHDMLGLEHEKKAKFVRKYMDGYNSILDSLNLYHSDVVSDKYPAQEESYFWRSE